MSGSARDVIGFLRKESDRACTALTISVAAKEEPGLTPPTATHFASAAINFSPRTKPNTKHGRRSAWGRIIFTYLR